ncbi:MAG: class I SAM-dependent methyltransferase [Methyloceanibacter sp.]
MTQVIQNVSDTAFMVAGFRALETEREEPLFRDPLAAKLAGEHGRKILATVPKTFVGGWSVVIRTVIIDALIHRAVVEGVDTILNLGAGLDTRPYRMDLPRGLRFVEVDYPHVIELKETRLAEEEPRCRLERIALDLTDRAARKAFLAAMSAEAGKILVLTEGVTPYLTEADVGALADDLRRTEKVRFWITDYFSPEAIKFGAKLRRRFMRNAPFQFTPTDWFGFFADQAGRRARSATSRRRPTGSAGPFRCRCG